MLKAVFLAVIVGLFSSGSEFQPPVVPIAGCASSVFTDEQGNVHENGMSCTVIIPGLAVD